MTTLKNSKLYRLQLNSALNGIDSILVIEGVAFGRLRDVCISPEGRVFISTSNSNASGTGSFVDKIIELSDSTFTGVGQVPAGRFMVSPNPADEELRVSFETPLTEETAYQVMDAQGRKVLSGIWQKGKKEAYLSLKNLMAGSYWLQVKIKGKSPHSVAFQKK